MSTSRPSASPHWERLERAALDEDDAAFDGALDAALATARNEANPEAGLQAALSTRLQAELGAEVSLEAPRPPPEPPPAVRAPEAGPFGRDSGVVAVVRESGRSLRLAQGVGLLAAGVAIGFVWGRAPAWQDARAHALEVAAATSSARAPEGGVPTMSAGEGAAAGPTGGDATPPGAVARASEANAASDAARPAATSARVASAAPAKTKARRATPPVDDRLRFVLQQLRKAQLFLRASEPVRALAALDELDARVPSTLLSDERDATRVLAWCDAGEAQKARVLAARVLERAPDSPYAVSLRESCAGRQELLEQMRERTSNPAR
ncbi:MAG TPA: hypothetical protein VMG12_10350 [Polyangiaceae bacterium]|nr:hypothetical protein [Polyangiaceae bacterium]